MVALQYFDVEFDLPVGATLLGMAQQTYSAGSNTVRTQTGLELTMT
jgi:hypothetical protein